jgi:hypothetical protein
MNMGGACNNVFVTPLAVQTEWINVFDTSLRYFLEFGTLQKTNSCKFWYAAYYYEYGSPKFNVFWTSVNLGQGGGEHRFELLRGTNWTWYYTIDVTREATLYWNGATGFQESSGLETAGANGATIYAHGYYDLLVNIGGPWYWFDYAHAWNPPHIDPPMCGRYINESSWQAAQNAPCN